MPDPSSFYHGDHVASPEKRKRYQQLMKHFGVTRSRVAVAPGHRSRFALGGTVGKTNTYLNKITKQNYEIMDHNIFRLLVDDSETSVGTVFDVIMKHSFRNREKSRLYARLCEMLILRYPELPAHIDRALEEVYAGLEESPEPTGDYKAYLEDVKRRRNAAGCFVFVNYLVEFGVMPRGTLVRQWDILGQVLIQSIKDLRHGDAGDRDLRRSLIDAYLDCIEALVALPTAHNVLHTSTPIHKTLVRALEPFQSTKARDKSISGKLWYSLVRIRDLMLSKGV